MWCNVCGYLGAMDGLEVSGVSVFSPLLAHNVNILTESSLTSLLKAVQLS